MNQLLEGFPELTVLLNEHRQIVAFNSHALAAFRTEDYFAIVGKRVGEAINCIHSNAYEGGCGTSPFCRECGAARAIKSTIDNQSNNAQECRITADLDGYEVSFDFRVHTQPIFHENKNYTLFTVQDISHEKRRDALEKIFFHDVLNTAGALKGLTEILPEIENENERVEVIKAIYTSSKQLVHEISSQRELRVAEDGTLEPHFDSVSSSEILTSVKELYSNHALNKFNNLVVRLDDTEDYFLTDPTLLIRSIGNLVKNALEASADNQKVTLLSQKVSNSIIFIIKNESVIPEHIQNQLFKRSFSTKQKKGRGLGLYSVKLIVEQFLNGKVTFASNEQNGTTFTISLPIEQA
ncbi:MAG: HAMP domain-containing histidine kinase [Melioribacteraceae bacterium]|nr:MAG: HAMP domain-containing histidine kinase [Melioribacteraceae bacterium]